MKKRILIILGALLTILSLVTIFILTKEVELKLVSDKTIEVEYGNEYKYTQKDLINKKDYSDREYKKLMKDLKITDNFKYEEGKDYLAIGKYKITVTYKDQKLTRSVVVSDTTKPQVKKLKDITVEEGTKELKFDGCIEATDLSPVVEITYDKAKVDLSKPGDYEVIATVRDSSGNEEQAKISVKVTKKPEVVKKIETYTPPKYTPSSGGGKVVCIDPGHQMTGNSAKEPIGPGSSVMKAKVTTGATGVVTGNRESQINLNVAMKLKSILESRGYTVIMCRTSQSVNISNAQRAQIANNANAAVFVRLHCDSASSSSATGISTLAPRSDNPYCGHIAAKSQRLANCLLTQTCQATGARRRSVITTNEMSGLNWSNGPVAIIEMGFLSNPDEDRLLGQSEYQTRLATGIANGIDAYLN